MLESKLMGDKKSPEVDLDFFDQIDEALEERKGTDRRQAVGGTGPDGKDRRTGDRRHQAAAEQGNQ